jgi:hypothetical protein
MRKLVKNSLILGLTLAIGFVLIPQKSFAKLPGESSGESSGGWFWKSETIPCTVTNTVGIDYIVVASTSETYAGTKKVCRDGWSLCWSTFCS